MSLNIKNNIKKIIKSTFILSNKKFIGGDKKIIEEIKLSFELFCITKCSINKPTNPISAVFDVAFHIFKSAERLLASGPHPISKGQLSDLLPKK